MRFLSAAAAVFAVLVVVDVVSTTKCSHQASGGGSRVSENRNDAQPRYIFAKDRLPSEWKLENEIL